MARLIARLERDGKSLKGLAEHIGLRRQSAYLWMDVPLEWIVEASEYSGLPPHRLRPDVAEALRARMPALDDGQSESGVDVDNILLALSDFLSRGARARIEAQNGQRQMDKGEGRAAEAAA